MKTLTSITTTTTQQVSKSDKKALLSKYTATTTYCQYTGIKLVIGTEFQNTNLKGKFLKQSHPIFSVPTPQLLKVLASYSKLNPTEKYLLTIAFLKSLDLLESSAPLAWNEETLLAVEPTFMALLRCYNRYTTNHSHALPLLPTLRITDDNSNTPTVFKSFLSTVINSIEAASFSSIRVSTSDDDDYKMNDELELEQQLKKIVDNYDRAARPKAYNSKLGKWAIKQLKIVAPTLDSHKLASISYYIQCDSLALNDELLKEYITLLSDVLPMGEYERERSQLVIRHLKSKLEDINKDLEDYGFVILEEEELTTGTRKSTTDEDGNKVAAIAGLKYKTKTITTPRGLAPKPVVPREQRQTFGMSDALSRTLAKFGSLKAPEVVTQGTTSNQMDAAGETSDSPVVVGDEC